MLKLGLQVTLLLLLLFFKILCLIPYGNSHCTKLQSHGLLRVSRSVTGEAISCCENDLAIRNAFLSSRTCVEQAVCLMLRRMKAIRPVLIQNHRVRHMGRYIA